MSEEGKNPVSEEQEEVLEGELEQAPKGHSEESEQDATVLLEDARAKADEHWNQCLRLQADLDNLHKRSRRDVENAHKFALEKFAVELLPVKDSLEMGITAASESADAEKLLEGSEMTLKVLSSALEKFGITMLDPTNERFNPEFHEAVTMQERDDLDSNTVITVIQKGYLLNERLIRPAMVIVSKTPA
ncbi:MAG: nucleotide exchange factor GrpE [Gammaproteobacteria bacterium]|nr:nucleotide exchange factor GrpE [Gammaproteobacteria bacterium]